jgi:hypothetical protein
MQSQLARAPYCGDAEGKQKTQRDEPSGECAFAPALEHGHQSNQENQNGASRQKFDQHATDLDG